MITWNLGTVVAGQSMTKQVRMTVQEGTTAPASGSLIRNSARVFHPTKGFISLDETISRVCAEGGTACDHMTFLPLLSMSVSGSGTITSSPAGVNCPGDCVESYGTGTVVTLTPNVASGWSFAGWSGDADCTDGQVTMNVDKACTATFGKIDPTSPINVQVTAPSSGQTISGTFALKGSTQDNSGTVQKIEFYIDADSAPACTDATLKSSGSTFTCNWDTITKPNGSHTVKAKAYDPAGNSAFSASVSFAINNIINGITVLTPNGGET